jgi:hypothetical protein
VNRKCHCVFIFFLKKNKIKLYSTCIHIGFGLGTVKKLQYRCCSFFNGQGLVLSVL